VLQLYVNYWEQAAAYQQFPALLVRSSAGAVTFDRPFRALLAREGHEYPLSTMALEDNLERTLVQERLLAIASSFFGGIGLVLAGSGLFSLLSVIVAGRTREFGIRMALGATRRGVVALVLAETLFSLACGLVAGLPLVWIAGRFVSSLLHDVSPVNLSAASVTVAAIALIAFLATWLPARRATRIDPLDAIRCE
jgi:ABC-type antimicrobial peptide transport system permease subunit